MHMSSQIVRANVVQNSTRQEHPGRFSPDASETDPVLVDGFEILHRQPPFGNVDVVQVIANQTADKRDLKLGKVMLKWSSLLEWQVLDP